jgi:citrate lyase subunit beta-like protein
VIHPSQLPIVHEAFSPSPDRIEWATNLIAEFREHESKGQGAFNFRGHMIDMPLVKQAQKILDMKERMN